MKGLVLAAGVGKRMKKHFPGTPKCFVEINGRPMILYNIFLLKKAGIRKIGIVIKQRNIASLKNLLKKYTGGTEFTYIFQGKAGGTADAVARAEKFLKDEEFLLTYCDNISPYDLRTLLKFHRKFEPSATLLICRTAGKTGQVIKKGKSVIKVVEKSRKKLSVFGATGYIVMTKDVISAAKTLKRPRNREFYIADLINFLLARGKKILCTELNTWRLNVNTKRDVKRAEVLIQGNPRLWEL